MRTMYILRTDDRPTDRPTSHFGKFQMAISPERVVRSTSLFDPSVGFSRTADRMDLLPVGPNPRSRPSAVLHNFEWPYR